MESCLAQVLQKDMGRRLQVGQEVIDYILDRNKSPELEQDQTALDKMVDAIASSWVNSSNFKVNAAGARRGRGDAVGRGHGASIQCPDPTRWYYRC